MGEAAPEGLPQAMLFSGVRSGIPACSFRRGGFARLFRGGAAHAGLPRCTRFRGLLATLRCRFIGRLRHFRHHGCCTMTRLGRLHETRPVVGGVIPRRCKSVAVAAALIPLSAILIAASAALAVAAVSGLTAIVALRILLTAARVALTLTLLSAFLFTSHIALRLAQKAGVVLGVLKEVLFGHPVIAKLCVPRKREVLVDDLLRRTANLPLRAGGIEHPINNVTERTLSVRFRTRTVFG